MKLLGGEAETKINDEGGEEGAKVDVSGRKGCKRKSLREITKHLT